MIGTRYPSEISIYTDPYTGRKVTKLTRNNINFHMYFTDNSFDESGNEMFFFIKQI